MTTKFNQDKYAKMRSKKNETLSNLEKRMVRVVRKGPFVTLAVPGTETTRTASSTTSVEEIATSILKKPRLADKGKEKADSHLSSVWDNVGLVVERAHEVITAKDLKVFSGMPSNEVVAHHIHKFIHVIYLCNFSLFFFFFCLEGFNFLFRCWGRVFISPWSTSLRKQRLRL